MRGLDEKDAQALRESAGYHLAIAHAIRMALAEGPDLAARRHEVLAAHLDTIACMIDGGNVDAPRPHDPKGEL